MPHAMRKPGVVIIGLVVAGLLLAGPVMPSWAEAPVDQAKIEEFLKKIVESQGGGKVVIRPERRPSPIEGLDEVRFFIESAGTRRPGVVYVSGDKLILGQMIDLSTQKNLTSVAAGRPTKISYRMDEFDLAGRPVRGDDSATLTLIEYSDFQCPFCQRVHRTIQTLMTKYPGKVRLYYKHFPLTSLHALAYRMALASECARSQREEAFWLLHDDLFNNQYTGGDEAVFTKRLNTWAAGAGLDGEKLTACIDNKEFATLIDADLEEGRTLGITGTPAIIANGEFLAGAQPIEVFERFLNPGQPPRPPQPPTP